MSEPVGSLRVWDDTPPVPAPDGFVAYITAPTHSAAAEPRAVGTRGGARVVWSPERGWTCQVHGARPCIHTEGLNPPGIPEVIL